MSRRLSVLVAMMLLAAGGCAHPKRWFTNRSIARDTLMKLPDDGAIVVEVEQVEGLGRPKHRATRYVWDQPGRQRKVLNHAGSEPARDVDPASASSRLSDDGNVAELLSVSGRVVATFDYTAGTATFLR